VERLTS